MKILVTGSSGFIGSKIIEALSLDDSIHLTTTTRNKKQVKKKDSYESFFSPSYSHTK